MEEIVFKLSKPPIKVFKSIRIRKIYYEANKTKQVIGHLNYLRLLTKEYDYANGDILDEQILKAAKSAFIEANPIYSVLLILDHQLEDCKIWTRGNHKQTVTTFLTPVFDIAEAPALEGKEFKGYKLPLSLNIQTTATVSGRAVIDPQPVDVFNLQIHHLLIDKLAKTIERA